MNIASSNTLQPGIKIDGRKRSGKSRVFFVDLRKLYEKNQVYGENIVVNLYYYGNK